jgi:cyanophycinase
MPDAGPLIAIGGHEDHGGDRRILGVVAARLGDGPLALVTAASRNPEGYVEKYVASFGDLGVTVVPVPADADGAAGILASAGGVFLTGGKQARLMRFFTRNGLLDGLRAVHERGAVIAGTSAGASSLAEVMMLRGPGTSSPGSEPVDLGDGLGLFPGVIIDQHFAQRGRGGRLRAAVAARPDCVGIGIDEDTAAEFRGRSFVVHGSGAVTVIDARGSRVRPGGGRRPATLHDARLHILADGDAFSLRAA